MPIANALNANTPGVQTLKSDGTWFASGFTTTPYVVGPVNVGTYQTVQAAVDAANAAGGGMVFIQPGTYTENLTLYTGIQLSSPSPQSVTIVGVHLPPPTGTLNLNRITFQSSTHVLSSTAAGTTTIIMEDCNVVVSNGYTFNLLNWIGQIQCFNIENSGTNDGFINNTGRCAFYLFSSGMGNGSGNTATISGNTILGQAVQVNCPVNFVTGANITSYGSSYLASVTCSNNSIVSFNGDTFSTGSSAAITQSSTGTLSLSNVSITTSNNPAIAGSGAGRVELANVTFVSDAHIANTLSLSTTGGMYFAGTPGTSGQALLSAGSGVVPAYGNLAVPAGGTGTTSFVAYNPVCGGTTTTGALQKVASAGTSGQALLSGGAASLPSYGNLAVAAGGTGATTLTGLLVGNGTSAITASTITQHDVLVGGASNAVTSVSPGSAGFVLTSNGTGSDPSFQAPTASLIPYKNVNTSPYTVLSTDYYLSVDCSSIPITLNFPAAPTANQRWIVKDRTGSAATHNISITTPGPALSFDGQSTYVMATNFQALNLIANSDPTYEVY